MPAARGVFLRKITRGATATTIPILPNTKIERGDILTIVGRTQDTNAATKLLGVADRPTDVADVAFIGAWIVVGALIGSLVFKVGGVPADAVDRRRRAHRGDRGRLAALGTPVLRAHPVAHRLVHELGGPQHIHRHCRHLRRPGLRQRPEDAGHRPVPVGRPRDHDPPGSRNVHRQVRVPLPRRAHARHRLRGAHDDGVARSGLRSWPRARCRRSATPSPTPSATRCSRSGAWSSSCCCREARIFTLDDGETHKEKFDGRLNAQTVREAGPVRDQGLPRQGGIEVRAGIVRCRT